MNEKLNSIISLIVPCYNIANICDRFFESLLRQTYTNIQLILVDDGSTDNTKEKLFSFKSQLEQKGYLFEYYYQENKGLGGAVNTGLKKVKGEYFCWADSDDYYEDDAFEVRIDYFIKHKDCMILTCDANIRDSKNISVVLSHMCDNIVHHNEPYQFLYLLRSESVFCSGIHMFKTEAFRKANPNMDIYESRRGQNWQLLLPMYYFFERQCLSNIVYNYVVYANSMSHSDLDYAKKNIRVDENKITQIETLKRIDMPKEERERYIRYVESLHAKEKMYNARICKNKQDFNLFFGICKKYKNLSVKDYLRGYCFKLFNK